MVEPVSHGQARVTYSGDAARAKGFLDKALHLLYQTQERARVGGLEVLSKTWRLDDDSYCYAVIAGGISAVHIVAGNIAEDVTPTATPAHIPDFVSGVMKNGFITTVPATRDHPVFHVAELFHPTQRCAAEFKLRPAYQSMQRLAVEPAPEFGSLRNNSDSGVPVFSQYTALKPTMYSGRMRSVVQALMGFGRQRRNANGTREISRYDTTVAATTAQKSAAPLSRAAQDTVSNGLQIRYDWQFSRTHGITVAADGKLWLVEISVNRGVSAMPLPLNPLTTTSRFRTALNNLGDADGLALLDAFGGFPTGEPFAVGAAFDAWVRAGRFMRPLNAADLHPFYDCASYSSAMGWAFKRRGDEAHNTAYYFDDDGVQHGVHYQVSLSISGSAAVVSNPKANTLRAAFSTTAVRAKFPDVIDAALFKLDRLSTAQLRAAAALLVRGIAAAVNYVDGLTLTPLATVSAALHKISDGYLWFPPRAKLGPHIKFPEPILHLLMSHNMKAQVAAAGADKRCDTTVHVFFAGDELKWVKFFRDPRTSAPQDTVDYEACMFQGTWSEHTEFGNRAIPDTFYTSDFDDRAEFAPSTLDTQIAGKSLGYCRIFFNDDILYPVVGDARRVKRFSRKATNVSVFAQSVAAAVAVPFFDREAYYYSVCTTHQGRSESISYGFQELFDPWWCNYWHNFPGLSGTVIGGVWRRAQHPDGCGPVNRRTAASPSPNYAASDCGDNADSGPWCFVCDDIESMLYNIPQPPTPPDSFTNVPSTSSYVVSLVNSTTFGTLTTHLQEGSWNPWPLFTPDLGDGFSEDQYIETTSNAFGEAQSLRYGININTGNQVIGVPNWPEMSSPSWLTYIGVIDGE